MNLSIIIPVYNSENILQSLVKEIDNALNKNIQRELILINDFSKDNSWEMIKKLTQSYSYIKGINFTINLRRNCRIAPFNKNIQNSSFSIFSIKNSNFIIFI